MASAPRLYIESCCFIDAAKHTIGLGNKDRSDDVWFLHQLLEAHKDKAIEVFTSVLTIAECTHADGNSDKRIRDIFDRLLTSGQYCILVQPTLFIAMDARDLRWKHNISLRGADGLHVASGLDRKCQELLTTDQKIIDNGGKIGPLGMRVIRPSETLLLPDKYRQGNMLDNKVKPIRRATGADKA